MSDKIDEIVDQFMVQNFSQEITDAEAVLFIASHPSKQFAEVILTGYMFIRCFIDMPPYHALKICMMSYLDFLNEN